LGDDARINPAAAGIDATNIPATSAVDGELVAMGREGPVRGVYSPLTE